MAKGLKHAKLAMECLALGLTLIKYTTSVPLSGKVRVCANDFLCQFSGVIIRLD